MHSSKNDNIQLLDSLRFLTEETFKKVFKQEIVTPSIYKDTFLKNAQDAKIKFDDEVDFISKQILEKIQNYENGVKDSANKLKSNIDSAKVAIDKKDILALKEIKNHIESIEKQLEVLQDELYTDPLTNLYNRKWLNEKLLLDGKFVYDGVLVFVDINKFKEINDNYGHIVGDKILTLISQLLISVEDSLVARYAGDEFIIIFKDYSFLEVDKTIGLLRDRISKNILKSGGNTFKISFEYGLCVFKTDDEFENILNKADKEMYSNKLH